MFTFNFFIRVKQPLEQFENIFFQSVSCNWVLCPYMHTTPSIFLLHVLCMHIHILVEFQEHLHFYKKEVLWSIGKDPTYIQTFKSYLLKQITYSSGPNNRVHTGIYSKGFFSSQHGIIKDHTLTHFQGRFQPTRETIKVSRNF